MNKPQPAVSFALSDFPYTYLAMRFAGMSLFNPRRICVTGLVLLVCLSPCELLAGNEPTDTVPAERISYDRDVRPIFQARCHGCHRPAKAESEYIMTDVDRLLAGGESGVAAIVPGDPSESFLIEMITPVDGEAEMPREGEPLSKSQVQLIREWIRQGAKDDSPKDEPKFDRDHPPRYLQPAAITSLDFSPDAGRLSACDTTSIGTYGSITRPSPPSTPE